MDHLSEAHSAEHWIEQELPAALSHGRIAIALQPRFHLLTAQVAGFEALARWSLPGDLAVPPQDFFAIAERSTLAETLGDRILEQTLAALDQWRDRSLPPLPVMVKLSGSQFGRDDVAARLAASLRRHRLPPSLLEVELNAASLLDDAQASMQTMHALRGLGIRLRLAGLGAVYPSFVHLRQFPVDSLKIDRSFVSRLPHDRTAIDVVRLIVQLAHRFRMRCVAEGIEAAEQLEAVRELGCDEAQGYFLARPTPPEQLSSWLAPGAPWARTCPALASSPLGP